jgi:hypothetical protein
VVRVPADAPDVSVGAGDLPPEFAAFDVTDGERTADAVVQDLEQWTNPCLPAKTPLATLTLRSPDRLEAWGSWLEAVSRDAAHIVPDADPLGAPVVPNGVALGRLHHAAFDRYLIGIRPDCAVEVRRDVLDDTDGPMLIHGLQGFHGPSLLLPRVRALRPDPVLLEVRYERFRQAG